MNEDALFLRRVPYSAEAEQAVLGSMLIDPECIKSVVDRIGVNDFYIQQNREIFETVLVMFTSGKPVDGLTVANEMQKAGTADDETRSYLAQLMEITPTSANALEYAAIVRDKAQRREIVCLATDAIKMAEEDTGDDEDIVEALEKRIYALRRGKNINSLTPLREIVPGVLDKIQEIAENGKLPGLSTGLSAIDRKLTGLNKSDLILLAARPAMGKTTLSTNIAMNVAKSTGKTVAIFALEMSKEQLAMRLLSAEALVEQRNLKTGKLSEQDWDNIAVAAETLNRVDLWIDDNPLSTVTEISAKCRRLENLELIVIDYLQLMNSPGVRTSENRQQAVSDISRMLKIMAKELNVPVLCLSQLSRNCEHRESKRPMLSDLRDSGAIEQDADIVLFLYRDDYYNPQSDKPNIAECIVAKNRHGETGKVELRWMPEYTMFATLEKSEE